MIEKSQLDELKLTGRIYPAIKSRVNNRWKIMFALFAYYNFSFSSRVIITARTKFPLDNVMSLILIIFVFQNLVNYYFNAKEQIRIERNEEKRWEVFKASKVEIFFDITAILSILLALKYL